MKLKLSLVLLVIFICGAGTLRAQSGRRQTSDKSTKSTSGKTTSDPAATNPAEEEEGMITQDTYQGETVEGDVLRVNTALVTVPVSVMDRNGKYIPDLARQDFHIFEEGVEQRITYFATVDQPFTVALVLDTSGSTDYRLDEIQNAAITFVNQLKPEDRVMVISFDDSIDVLTKPTNDRDELTKAIRRTRTGGGTRLYDAVHQVINKHFKGVTGRKAIVLFTDGVDTTSRQASYDSTLREAEELDALIYPVAYDTRGGLGSVGGVWGSGGPRIPFPGGGGGVIIGTPGGRGRGGPTPADYQRARIYLSELALKTGGRLYNGNSMLGISQAFAHIADELRRQYSLGYYPRQRGQAGQRRRIKVRVNQPNLVVQARESYVYTPKVNDDAVQPDKQQFSSQKSNLGPTR